MKWMVFFFSNSQHSIVNISAWFTVSVFVPLLSCSSTLVFAGLSQDLSKTSWKCIRCLTQTNLFEAAVIFMAHSEVHAICELRLPFNTSCTRNMSVRYPDRCQITFFPLFPARNRLISVYSKKWGASDICLKLKPKLFSAFFYFCRRFQTLQTCERQSWDKIWTCKSNYNREMTVISQLLAAPKYMHHLFFSVSQSRQYFRQMRLGPWKVTSLESEGLG